MSNVLIGIIGVILFIGLALAGALFLGPRFQESTNNSKAAAIVQHMQQLTSAMNMYHVNEGRPIVSSEYNDGTSTLVSGGYVKTTLRNPLNNMRYVAVDDAGYGYATPARYVYADIGSDATAVAVCKAIERQAGATDSEASTKTSVGWSYAVQNRRAGCLRMSPGEIDVYMPL